MIVSVVTPSYNQATFIERTMTSVLEQEGDFSIDYIIMDGGSSDESVNIIRKYEQLLAGGRWPIECRDVNLRWVSQRDGGQSHAINSGFERATGDVGVWLNSDDFFCDRHVLEKVVKHFREDPDLDLLVGDGWAVDKGGNPLWRWQTQAIDMKELTYLDDHILQPAAFARIHVFREFPLIESYHYSMDLEFFMRVISSGKKIKKIGENLACLRLYPQTKTASGSHARLKEARMIMRQFGTSIFCYLVGSTYQYVSIVWGDTFCRRKNTRRLFHAIRALSYRLVLGKWRR